MNSFCGTREISNDSKLLILDRLEPGFNIRGKTTPPLLSKEPDKAFHYVWSPWGESRGPPGLRSSDGEAAQSGFSQAHVSTGTENYKTRGRERLGEKIREGVAIEHIVPGTTVNGSLGTFGHLK